MALTRAMIRDMGVTEKEVIDSIMEAHGETINLIKEKNTQKEADYKTSLSDLQTNAEDYKAKYESEVASHEKTRSELDKKYNDFEIAVNSEKQQQSIKDKLSELLKTNGMNEKAINKALKLYDISSVEMDDKGKIRNEANVLENFKVEWDGFFATEKTDTYSPPTPPLATTQGTYTLEQIKSMTPTEINANWDKGVKQTIEKGK